MSSSSGSASAHSDNNPSNQEVNQSQALTSHAASFIQNRYEKITLVKKPNNYYLQPSPSGFPEFTYPLLEILRNHPLHYALSATKPTPETYITQFLLSSYVCTLEGVGLSIVGYVSHPTVKSLVPLEVNVDTLRTALHLPTLEALNLDDFAQSPTDSELMEFLAFHSYASIKPITKRTEFKRKGLPPLWNTLFSIVNCCLTGKVGSHDQTSHSMLSIMYGIYFNLALDYAQLIFEDMVGLIKKKCATQKGEKTKVKV